VADGRLQVDGSSSAILQEGWFSLDRAPAERLVTQALQLEGAPMPVEHSPNQSRGWRSSGHPSQPANYRMPPLASCAWLLPPASCFVTVH
jgi:hypothetical protein